MTARTIIDNWLNGVERDLIGNYNRLGLKASGLWEQSLEPFTNTTNDGFKIGIKGQDYTEQLENGRRPNRNQSPEALKAWVGWAGSTFLADWVNDKGIDVSPYAVAWGIARNGWVVPNANNAGGLVSDVVTTDRISQLNKELVLFQVGELRSDIIKQLKNGNN